MSPKISADVVIVGGGLVGLCAALLAQYHGVDCILVERRAGPSVLPRSRGLHARTSEIFRQLGIEERVRDTAAKALKAGAFGGFRIGPTMLTAEALDIGTLAGHFTSASPSTFCFLPQVELEPLIVEIARERHCDLRVQTEVTSLLAHSDGVETRLAEVGTGREYVVNAAYVIAADGANSTVRRALGITGWQLPPTHHYVNVFFRANLADRVAGRTFSQCQIDNDDVHGLMLAKNNTDEWSLHVEYDPAVETIADYSVSRCVDLVRAAIGVPEIEVDVLARAVWDTGVYVADEYRRGRILLAGDAAHRHAPFGGYGANTGIADVHNLVWKLAAVLDGVAGQGLLDTYETERRDRAVTAGRQARLRTDVHTRFASAGAPDTPAELLDIDAVMSRFRYRSAAVFDPAPADAHVADLAGQPGTRVPHVWFTRAGQRLSTLDPCGPGFTVITDGSRADWRTAAERASANTRCDVTVCAIGDDAWSSATALPRGGALLVRPDRHVAASSEHGLTPATLQGILAAILR